jgi:hypothetical protein
MVKKYERIARRKPEDTGVYEKAEKAGQCDMAVKGVPYRLRKAVHDHVDTLFSLHCCGLLPRTIGIEAMRQ